MNISVIIKCLQYAMAIIFVVFLVTAELNVPPSSYLISIYCNAFDTDKYYSMAIALLPSVIFVIPIQLLKRKLNSSQNTNQNMKTDAPYINNKDIPVWIVAINGWGSDSMEDAYKRMNAYKTVAEKWKINIEFSSRLGTFQSYKHAPLVAEEISKHNEQTFAVCEKMFGKDWRSAFVEEVHKIHSVSEE